MRLAFPALAIRFPFPLPVPQPRFPHPPPQTFGSDLQAIVAGQVRARQRRSEIRVTLPHPTEHRLAKLPRVRPIRPPPAVAVLQSSGPAPAIPRPHPLRLPITQLQQLRRFSQPQAARLHPSHHFRPTQLLRAQVRSPQSECLLPEASPKWGHFYCVSEGTFLMWFNTSLNKTL